LEFGLSIETISVLCNKRVCNGSRTIDFQVDFQPFAMQFSYAALALAIMCIFLISNAWAGSKKGDMNSYYQRTGAKYLEEVAKKEGVIKLKSGMLVEILNLSEDPNARSPNAGDSCEVTYMGTFKDGKRFDSGTTSFAPNQVIKGWTEAMQLMGEGDKWKLHIPYDLAYGDRGSPPRIPPYTPLVFEIEIHKVKGGKGKPIAEAREAFKSATEVTAEL
jgi:FKBP-type peptidyl-prolyl cis-trans isomerase FklB